MQAGSRLSAHMTLLAVDIRKVNYIINSSHNNSREHSDILM